MSESPKDAMGNRSMLELFRAEAETQTASLSNGLLELERGESPTQVFDALMRAAHSLKGAARIVNLQLAVRLAHALEDCFVAARKGNLRLRQPDMDLLFAVVDLLAQLGKRTEANLLRWETEAEPRASQLLRLLLRSSRPQGAVASDSLSTPGAAPSGSPGARASSFLFGSPSPAGGPPDTESLPSLPGSDSAWRNPSQALVLRKPEPPERVLRLAAENLNRLLALAGESLVESRWLRPFADSFERLKREQMELAHQLELMRTTFAAEHLSERARGHFNELFRQIVDCQQFLAERMQDLDMFDRRTSHLAQRLYLEVLRTRMRPFSDGVRRFPRMVRDLARALGKNVKLEISGETTQVDRDILERLETPLAHLLRNAVDHGCESTPERQQAGKPVECCLRIEAHHSAGVLLVTVADDGQGVDLEQVRRAVTAKRLVQAKLAQKLTESELLEFLFLPGFTLKENVTEISGRGFGLDVVQNMVRGVRGAIRLNNQPGRGLRVQLQLPLTLSVVRALLVEVAGEPYAIPLSQITRTLKLARSNISALEGRHHFQLSGQQVGLLTAHEVLDCGSPPPHGEELPVVVLSDRSARYGLVVDRFLGERELVVQPLDGRLGKVKDISAAALMEDGSPVLIIDVEDMVRSIDKLLSDGRLATQRRGPLDLPTFRPKRVLAVDDSLTVRELERKLLSSRGFQTDVAVDGMAAWNAIKSGEYDLVITDVDMPRLDGIGLVNLIKQDPRLRSLPVLIVSYKDRDADRLRGLEAGADYYLTKGSFHDETLLQAVIDLIGEPES